MNRKQLFIVEMMAVVLVISIGIADMLPRFLGAQNYNTPEHFPDPVFRREVENLFGVEPGGRISSDDIQSVTKIHLYRNNIESFQGIEYFTELTRFDISENLATELNFSSNHKLTSLHLRGSQLKHLDISGCQQLKVLHVVSTDLVELDLSGNPALTKLYVYNNEFTTIDVTVNPKLTVLNCNYNPLVTLDVTGLTKLEELYCSKTELSEIDLSTNMALSKFYCYGTKLQSLDVTNNLNLSELICNNTPLTELDISRNPKLWKLIIENCFLSEINTSNNPYLQILDIKHNRFEQMPDLRSNNKLITLYLMGNLFDCEDWEMFQQQKLTLQNFNFYPQQGNGITDCSQDIKRYESKFMRLIRKNKSFHLREP